MEDSAAASDQRAEELKQQASAACFLLIPPSSLFPRPSCLLPPLTLSQGTKEYAEGRYEKALELFTQVHTHGLHTNFQFC